VKEILSSQIMKEISNLSAEDRVVTLREQGIESFYEYHIQRSTASHLKENRNRNVLLLDFAEGITKVLSAGGIEFAFLKGIILLDEIYPSLEDRFLSDIDLLISNEDFESAMAILKSYGEVIHISKGSWVGDAHKVEIEYRGPFGLDITLELHNKLYWHRNHRTHNIVKAKDKLPRLDDTDHLIYLIYHYAFQHNGQKLYWLFDIIEFYKKYRHQINWDYFNNQIVELGVSRCSLFVKKIVKEEFDIDIFEIKGRTTIPLKHSYMLSADQRSLYYLFLKFILKDKIIHQGFFYLIKWLRRSK